MASAAVKHGKAIYEDDSLDDVENISLDEPVDDIYTQNSRVFAAGKSKKRKRGVLVVLMLAVVAAGVFVGLYFENRKTAKAEAGIENYDGPCYCDEKCLSRQEEWVRNLKGDAKTPTVNILINGTTIVISGKRDEEGQEGEESSGSDGNREHIIITSNPKPEAETTNLEHYRKVRYLNLRTVTSFSYIVCSLKFISSVTSHLSVPREMPSMPPGLKAGERGKVISSGQYTRFSISTHFYHTNFFPLSPQRGRRVCGGPGEEHGGRPGKVDEVFENSEVS